jgi:hypothetical protein
MRRTVISLVLGTTLGWAALAGCTLLTDSPDDASSGYPKSTKGPDANAPANADGGRTDAEALRDAPDDRSDPSQPPVVTLDSVGPDGQGVGGTNKTSPLVWAHTTNGTNRAIFVAVAISADPDTGISVSGVTYENVPFALVKTQHTNNQDGGYVTLWALTNPSEGTHSVSVTFSGNPNAIIGGSISFTGVDQATPYQNVTALGGTGPDVKLSVNSAPGNMVIAALASGCDVTSSGQSIGWFRNVNCNFGGGNGAESAAPGAPLVELSYKVDDDWWGIIGADVKAAVIRP